MTPICDQPLLGLSFLKKPLTYYIAMLTEKLQFLCSIDLSSKLSCYRNKQPLSKALIELYRTISDAVYLYFC